MYAYMLLSLALALVATEVAKDRPPDAAAALGGTAAAAVLVLAAGLAISLYIRRQSRRIQVDQQRFLRKVGLLGRLYRLFVVGIYATVLFGLGWASLAAYWAGPGAWSVARFAIATAPLVVFQAAAWAALFSADRRLRAFLFEREGAAVAVRQWTLPRYLEFMFRQYLLIILVPLMVLVAANDAIVELVGPPESHPSAAALLVVCMTVAAVLSGAWFRLCWHTQPLPEGMMRDRLQAMADRAGIRVANILVWRTNVTIVNGCMVGMVGPLRYILITDALLLSLAAEEIEAVFAHEVAHVKFRHVVLYVVMAMGGASAGLMAGEAAAMLHGAVWTQNVAVAAVILLYWGLAFGFVSRRCEQECDLYAVRAPPCPVGCPDGAAAAAAAANPAEPSPAGQGGTTASPPGNSEPLGAGLVTSQAPAPWPAQLCEHRVMAMVGALRRIARMNGTPETARGWRHFSIARRCRFLEDVLADPALATRALRSLRRLKAVAVLSAMVLMLAAGLVTLAWDRTSESDNPENPAGPGNLAPVIYCRLMRLVDGNQVDAVAFRAPQFGRDADAVADLDNGHHSGLRCGIAARNHEVAVQEPRCHAVAVDAKGKGSQPEGARAGKVQELDDALRRRSG